jgi:hypothetical protein
MRSSRGCRCLAGPLPRSAVSRPRTMSSCCCSRAHLPIVAVHSSRRPASASPWPHARPRLCSKQPAVDSLPTTADLAPGGGIARSLLQGSGSSLQSQLGQRDQRLRVAVDVDEGEPTTFCFWQGATKPRPPCLPACSLPASLPLIALLLHKRQSHPFHPDYHLGQLA